MSNLLDQFVLAHTQLTRLNADLKEIVPAEQKFTAKVELKLTPRAIAADGDVNQFQVTARLLCQGRREGDASIEPLFTIELVLQAVYRQYRGDPVTIEVFTRNHASLTRQLYPLIHHLLQPVLKQFGLDQVKLPYDLAERQPAKPAAEARQIH